MGPVVADIPQGLVGVIDNRRALVRADRGDSLTLVRDPSGVGDDHLLGLVRSQIFESRQHLLRGPQIQRRLVITVLKSFSRHDDAAVHLILGIEEMDVAGGAHRLAKPLSQPHDPPV